MLNTIKKIISKDGSINYILPFAKSFVECRYVRRSPEYVSVYVSSHNGCKMGCKFCWLTAQNQTKFNHVDLNLYNLQLDTVLKEIKDTNKENIRINVNFMARGESLANKTVINNYSTLYNMLEKTACNTHGFGKIKMNLSTIMPNTIKNNELFDIFGNTPVNLYYFLYTTNDLFKKTLMPNAINCQLALDKLKKFQEQTENSDNNIVFHWAFIECINDNEKDVMNIICEIKKRNFKRIKFNLVRFNPPIGSNLKEPSSEKLNYLFNILKENMNDSKLNKKSTIIDRVGTDAYISCGMFINDYDV